jgi:hypothetical protein
LRPDLALLTQRTPLLSAFSSVSCHTHTTSERSAITDIIQSLLEISRDSEDFETHLWRDLRLYIADSPQITNWLWDHVMSNSSGSELLTFQAIIFRDIVTCLNSYRSADTYTNMQILVPKMAKSNLLLDNILMGNIDALVHLWSWAMRDDTESQKLGSRYIDLLSSLSVDFKRSIEAELKKLPGRTLQDKRFEGPDRKILFYQDGNSTRRHQGTICSQSFLG